MAVQQEIEILMLHGVLHLLGMDHEKDRGRMARAETKWRAALGLPCGLIERARRMTWFAVGAAVVCAVLLCLVTVVQILYLESLRLRARDLPALEFFKETLEDASAWKPKQACWPSR